MDIHSLNFPGLKGASNTGYHINATAKCGQQQYGCCIILYVHIYKTSGLQVLQKKDISICVRNVWMWHTWTHCSRVFSGLLLWHLSFYVRRLEQKHTDCFLKFYFNLTQLSSIS